MSSRTMLSLLLAALPSALLPPLAAPLRAEDPPAPYPPTVADGAKLEVVHDESATLKRFFEGPSYDPETDALYFTAFLKEASQILKLDAAGKVSVFLDKSQGINGTYLSRRGGLLCCQGDTGKIVRIPITATGPGEIQVLAESIDGRPLGKPNDLVEDPKGGIYFTCPDFAEKKTSAVYYRAPNAADGTAGKVMRAVADLQTPNGIFLAKGNLFLYVSDSAAKKVRRYPVDPVTGKVMGKLGKDFLAPNTANQNDPDGMTLDEEGNLYATGRGGVWVVDPDGKILGMIPIPEFCSNVTFGGKEGRTLYFTCAGRVYRLAMKARGWEAASRLRAVETSPLKFRSVEIDPKFRSEGVAIADVNHDGKNDIIAGEIWYEAPSWKPHEIAEPGTYDGATGYSRCFGAFSEDWTGDGFPDLLVIPFPGEAARWYQNPQGKEGRWKAGAVWPSACNETPIFVDLLGTGKRVLVMGWQPPEKENEGTMAYLVPPSGPDGKWEEHSIGAPGKSPGTNRFSHGLGAGDVNGDGLADVLIKDGWWEHPKDWSGKGEWAFHPVDFVPDCSDIHVDDLNGDGLNDVLASSSHAYGVWWVEQKRTADGKSEWVRHLIDQSFSQSHALQYVDLDGDGVTELVTGKRYFAHMGHDPGEFEPVVLYYFKVEKGDAKQGTAPRFTPHLIDLGAGIATQYAIGDIDGDGKPDIAVSSKRGVHILFQEGAK